MVYIASPLRGDYETNLKQANEYCRLASTLDVLPVAPHIMYSSWCRDFIPEERQMGLKLGLELLKQSDELWVMGRNHSEGMKGEIQHAKAHQIPTYFIPEPFRPETYPVSCDGHALLCQKDAMGIGADEDITGQLVLLHPYHLHQQSRSPINQLWIATHGPGCRPDSFSGTVQLQHPLDRDRTAVSRNELLGMPTIETIEKLEHLYPVLSDYLAQPLEADEELER